MYITLSILYVFVEFLHISEVDCKNTTIVIPLNKNTTYGNKELYGDFINSTALSTIQVEFENVSTDISFIIFQVHSYLYNVTLYNNTYIYGSYVSGTNIGLYSPIQPEIYTFYVLNTNNVDLKLYISVHGYQITDPIPGGCSMEFSVPISPFIVTVVEKDYFTVEVGAPRLVRDLNNCNFIPIENKFYRMYAPENNLDIDVYFESIKKMMTYDSILEHGDLVPMTSPKRKMKRMLNSYPGTGSVHVVVARTFNNKHYSVYVPTHTYACSPLHDNCQLYDDFVSQSFCAVLLFIGLFICYFGHRFFRHQMFLMGVLSGLLLTYIIVSMNSSIDRLDLLGASILCGLFFGSIWLIFWWLYGIPVVAVCLTTLNMGFLFASLLYFMIPDGSEILIEDINFWSLFILIMLLTSVVMVTSTLTSNLLCCALLGAYAVIFPLDCYFGTSLKYILVNIIRRAVVPDFNIVVISPPFELGDILLVLLWVLLAMSGFLFQQYHNKGRPPFPPPPRSVGPVFPEVPAYGATDVVDPRERLLSVGGRSTRFGSDIANRLSITPSFRRNAQTDRTPLLG